MNYSFEAPAAKTPQKASNISNEGLHVIGNLHTQTASLLQDSASFKEFIDEAIVHHKLNKLGEVYHDFPSGGFTAVVCLSESHLSVHTWPERNYLTFDIFLSNYRRNNQDITRAIYAAVCKYFGATATEEHFIAR